MKPMKPKDPNERRRDDDEDTEIRIPIKLIKEFKAESSLIFRWELIGILLDKELLRPEIAAELPENLTPALVSKQGLKNRG